ncbi:MAG: hypothetical protein ACTSUK_03130 [Promethearchaeota archaeon]
MEKIRYASGIRLKLTHPRLPEEEPNHKKRVEIPLTQRDWYEIYCGNCMHNGGPKFIEQNPDWFLCPAIWRVSRPPCLKKIRDMIPPELEERAKEWLREAKKEITRKKPPDGEEKISS